MVDGIDQKTTINNINLTPNTVTDSKKGRSKMLRAYHREKNRAYRKNNLDKIRESHKKYYEKNKEKFKQQSRQKYLENREKVLAQQKQYYHANKTKRHIKDKNYYENNKATILEKRKQKRLIALQNKQEKVKI